MNCTTEELQQKPSLMTVQQFRERLDLLDQDLVLLLAEFLRDTGIGVSSVNMELNDPCEYEVTIGMMFHAAKEE